MTQQPRPFRAEHLGSLLRPSDLLQARESYEASRLSLEELVKTEDTAVKIAIKLQTDLGYRGLGDGEYRRGVFCGSFFQELEGMTEVQNPPLEFFRTYVPDIAGFLEKAIDQGRAACVLAKSGTQARAH